MDTAAKNVLGTELQSCSAQPLTGYYRDGCCHTGPQDSGRHVVCAQMTDEFLNFTAGKGNDLITPQPHFQFPGLKAGDRWCLCAIRWREAYEAGYAPPVILESCHEQALQYTSLEALKSHQLILS